MYQFGSGNLFGLAGAVPVARKFGALQGVSIDFSFNLKELYGQLQFPLTVARGQGKIDGKANFASLNGALLNDLFFGATNATGQTVPVIGEAAVAGASVVVANGATFKEDLGVTDATTGLPMTRVASAPAAGQYSVTVATGTYAFAAGDNGKAVLIDYAYTQASSGNMTTITNQLTGAAPTFAISLPMKYNGKTWYMRLNACVSSKLAMATKMEDFTVPEFDFKAFADAAGVIGYISSTE